MPRTGSGRDGPHASGQGTGVHLVGRVGRLDVERELRTGIPEMVLAEGKRDEDLRAVALAMARAKGRAVVTRLPEERVPLLRDNGLDVTYHRDARVAVLASPASPAPARHGGAVGILAAGTSDVAVCEEARVVAEEMGSTVATAYDVGVAGLHRLQAALRDPAISGADVLVAAAGREGALATVVSGLVAQPVIGLPVGTGYGVGGRGEAALFSMLQACSPLLVVNVDAGFVAGACAARIAARIAEARNHGR